LIVSVYSPLSIAAIAPLSLSGQSSAMDPSLR
jgi:hypothetical protein